MNQNQITEIVFILDRSGSMSGLESDTIGGFNSMIEQQKEKEGTAYISTVLFNHESFVLHDRVELKEIEPLTRRDYVVGGSTALIDAIGEAIHHIGNIHKYARKEDVPEHTMFVIMTDGYDEVKRMIERQKEKYGWEFIFIGANIDAVQTARTFGIQQDRAVNYHADAEGTHVAYQAVSQAVVNMRCGAPMAANWSKNIDDDYKKRKRDRKRR